MLIPYGLDEMRLPRMPWATVGIVVACVLCHAALSASSAGEAAERRFEVLVETWRNHPGLETPPELEARTGLTRERLQIERWARHAPREPEAGLAEARDRLAAQADAFAEALEASPAHRWGLVPAKGLLQPGWITSLFVHQDLGHLLGNMLVFALVAGPFLEAAWGPAFFLALYLLGGVAAGAAQTIGQGGSVVPLIGASGAISACLGAFALRFAHRRVRMAYWFFLFVRGTFLVPAWLYALLGFGADLLFLSIGGRASHVAYAAHVGGFLFGVAVAAGVRASGLDARLTPEGMGRWGASLDATRAGEALASGDLVEARRRLEPAVTRRADDEVSLLALARLSASQYDRGRATELTGRLLRLRLAAGDLAGARALLTELGGAIEPAQLEPATAFRAAELVAVSDPALATRLDEAAATAGGGLAAKALVRSAQRLRAAEPERAQDLLRRVVALGPVIPELHARAKELLAGLPPPPDVKSSVVAVDDLSDQHLLEGPPSRPAPRPVQPPLEMEYLLEGEPGAGDDLARGR